MYDLCGIHKSFKRPKKCFQPSKPTWRLTASFEFQWNSFWMTSSTCWWVLPVNGTFAWNYLVSDWKCRQCFCLTNNWNFDKIFENRNHFWSIRFAYWFTKKPFVEAVMWKRLSSFVITCMYIKSPFIFRLPIGGFQPLNVNCFRQFGGRCLMPFKCSGSIGVSFWLGTM